MFRFIKNIFLKKSKLSPIEPSNTSEKIKKREAIPYNPHLIMSLEADHQVLLSSYARIMKYAKNKQFPGLTLELIDFSDLLNSHLSKENNSLYMYLEFTLIKKNGEDDRKLFHDLHNEMKAISTAITTGINKYTNVPVTNSTVEQFIKDFTILGNVLSKRIVKEEKVLYPIYLGLPD